jgi:hypothetical protein
MGASVIAYWPGMTEEQLESQPGFYNDCKAWGDWMAEREADSRAEDVVRALGAGAILTYKTDGMEDEEVKWVTPQKLGKAALKLRAAVEAALPGTEVILETYGRNANGVDPLVEEFVRDLDDVKAIADWAESEGTKRITLEVNW